MLTTSLDMLDVQSICVPIIPYNKLNLCTLLLRTDIDECSEDNGGCQLTCTNTMGSYTCECGADYVWDDVHHACVGELLSYDHLPYFHN